MPGSKPGALDHLATPLQAERVQRGVQCGPGRASGDPRAKARRQGLQCRLRRGAIPEFHETAAALPGQPRLADLRQRGERSLDGRFAAAQHRLERVAERGT